MFFDNVISCSGCRYYNRRTGAFLKFLAVSLQLRFRLVAFLSVFSPNKQSLRYGGASRVSSCVRRGLFPPVICGCTNTRSVPASYLRFYLQGIGTFPEASCLCIRRYAFVSHLRCYQRIPILYRRRLASLSVSKSARMSPSRTGPFTLRISERPAKSDSSAINVTLT